MTIATRIGDMPLKIHTDNKIYYFGEPGPKQEIGYYVILSLLLQILIYKQQAYELKVKLSSVYGTQRRHTRHDHDAL